jgi:hypothetical protein
MNSAQWPRRELTAACVSEATAAVTAVRPNAAEVVIRLPPIGAITSSPNQNVASAAKILQNMGINMRFMVPRHYTQGRGDVQPANRAGSKERHPIGPRTKRAGS